MNDISILTLDIANTTGVGTFTAGANASGSALVTISVVDTGGLSNSTEFTITVTSTNDAPWIDQPNNITMSEDNGTSTIYTSTEVNNSFRDVEDDQTPTTLTLLSQSDTAAVSCTLGDGIACTSVANQSGSNTLTLEMNDSSDSAVRQLVTVTVDAVNDAPWTDQLGNVTMGEDNGTSTIYTSAQLNNSFRDVEDDQTPTTITLLSQSNATAVNCSVGDGIACVTAANESGANTISIEMNDSGLGSVTQAVTITVVGVNDAPWWDLITNFTALINEDSSDNNVSAQAYWQDYFRDVEDDQNPSSPSVTTNDTDSLTCSVASVDLKCSSLNNATGSVAVTLTAQDGGGLPSIFSFEIAISALNDAPWIDLDKPDDNTTNTTTNAIDFTYTPRDVESSISNCSLIINQETNVTASAITVDSLNNLTVYLTNGEYNWSVNCTDDGNIIAASETRNLSINASTDSTAPTITLENPEANITNTTTNALDFTYNVSDSSDIANCTLMINDEINATDTTVEKDTAGQSLIVTLSNGEYNWSVNCTDALNNIGASEARTLSVNYTAPATITQTGESGGGGRG